MRQRNVAEGQRDIADVVPDVGQRVVIGHAQCPLKAAEAQVVLVVEKQAVSDGIQKSVGIHSLVEPENRPSHSC